MTPVYRRPLTPVARSLGSWTSARSVLRTSKAPENREIGTLRPRALPRRGCTRAVQGREEQNAVFSLMYG